jgi:hypothetical protein
MTDFATGFNKDEILKRCLDADVVVFQRPNDSVRVDLMRHLKQKGKFVVFENDDTYLPDKGVPLNMLGSDKARELAIALSNNLTSAMRVADLVIASTETLANEYRQTTDKPVEVLKNTVDPMDEFTRKRVPGKTRIGFIGSVSTNDDYTHIIPAILELDKRDDITFVCLGHYRHNDKYKGYEADDAFWDTVKNVEWHTFVPATRYHKKLSDMALDMALIPRKDNYFNRCKSNVKFLECSLHRIPVIAQGFTTGDSPYQYGNDSEYMQVVTKDEDWLPTVENTIKNYDKYARLANDAHDFVLKEYNIKTYAPYWRQIIEKYYYANRP